MILFFSDLLLLISFHFLFSLIMLAHDSSSFPFLSVFLLFDFSSAGQGSRELKSNRELTTES